MSTSDQLSARDIEAGTDEHRAFLNNAPVHGFNQIKDNKVDRNDTRVNATRQNAALRPETWRALDDELIQTQENTLTLVQDLQQAGLTTEVDLMTKIDTWPLRDDTGSAKVAETPESRVPEISETYEEEGCTVPITYAKFSLGFRDNPQDGTAGQTPDMTLADTAARLVAERTEQLVLGNPTSDLTFSGRGGPFNLYGLTDHPTATVTGFTSADWTVDNTVIRSDLRSMRSIIKNDNRFRPGGTGYWLYLGTQYYDTLDDADPEGDGNQTVRDRVENLANISQVKELDYLPEKSALMFRPTRDVIDLGVASGMQTVQWEDPFRDEYYVLSSIYPRVKYTSSGQSGIAFWTAP